MALPPPNTTRRPARYLLGHGSIPLEHQWCDAPDFVSLCHSLRASWGFDDPHLTGFVFIAGVPHTCVLTRDNFAWWIARCGNAKLVPQPPTVLVRLAPRLPVGDSASRAASEMLDARATALLVRRLHVLMLEEGCQFVVVHNVTHELLIVPAATSTGDADSSVKNDSSDKARDCWRDPCLRLTRQAFDADLHPSLHARGGALRSRPMGSERALDEDGSPEQRRSDAVPWADESAMGVFFTRRVSDALILASPQSPAQENDRICTSGNRPQQLQENAPKGPQIIRWLHGSNNDDGSRIVSGLIPSGVAASPGAAHFNALRWKV